MLKKIQHLGLALLTSLGMSPSLWAQSSPPQAEAASFPGPVSLEPAVEKNGVRVALRTSIRKKDELTVFVKISNLSEQPILVSPDAIEASTEEGFIIQPIGSKKTVSENWNPSSDNSSWKKISKVAAFIPFSDPYHILSSAKAIANYAEKKSATLSKLNSTPRKSRGLLKEVILQPGMATHGLIIYDASSLKAFDYAPTLHIKVIVGQEPFEFKFASETQAPSYVR